MTITGFASMTEAFFVGAYLGCLLTVGIGCVVLEVVQVRRRKKRCLACLEARRRALEKAAELRRKHGLPPPPRPAGKTAGDVMKRYKDRL